MSSQSKSPVESKPPVQAGEPQNLARIARGCTVRVVLVVGEDDLACRLDDQGVWPGAVIELVTSAPGGDPMLFRLHGYRLALRRDEAARVLVEAVAGRTP